MFVLGELPRLDLLFPARLVALRPLAAAEFRRQRLVVPRLGIGLALVLALLVDNDLLFLPARDQAEGHYKKQKPPHDFVPLGCGCCCGGTAPGLPGPSAGPQPQTSEPLPRRSTRSR